MQSYLRDHITYEWYEENPIPLDYSPYTKNQVSRILKTDINDAALSRRSVEWISIDDINSPDLDDAIWAERTKNGYCVWIHISDVSESVPIFSPLDLEALQRTTSVYLGDDQIDMIPKTLSHFDLSLHAWEKKLTLSLEIELDNEWNVINQSFYESAFNNIRRYDYDDFQIDARNPESKNFSTIALLSEISHKLRSNRNSNWGLMDYDEWMKRHKSWNHHKIIESLMVLANQTTGNFMVQNWLDTIYKRHDNLNEISFYKASPSFHTWLQIHNYTQFTSPIRRYIDIVNHRIIKALLKKEESPYRRNDLLFIAEHMNNTRLKLDILGSQLKVDNRWWEFMKRTRDRLKRELEVHDMKEYIRNCTYKDLRLPMVMKHAIEKKILTGKKWNWMWWAGTLLLWRDNDIKKIIKNQVFKANGIWPRKMLRILAQTQILKWQWNVFEVHETINTEWFEVKIDYKWKTIAKSHHNLSDPERDKRNYHETRSEAIDQLFSYFID